MEYYIILCHFIGRGIYSYLKSVSLVGQAETLLQSHYLALIQPLS